MDFLLFQMANLFISSKTANIEQKDNFLAIMSLINKRRLKWLKLISNSFLTLLYFMINKLIIVWSV